MLRILARSLELNRRRKEVAAVENEFGDQPNLNPFDLPYEFCALIKGTFN